ncbi:MAG: oxidoreductase-like domain-containing protein [Pseudomonadota bacterium]|nr:oxidoreductase-like domain-containing protein [Pseudomonadota bacterium]
MPDDDPPPVAPVRPDNDECCGGGCTPCIFDLYEEARERHEAALAAWRERNADRGQQQRVTCPHASATAARGNPNRSRNGAGPAR